MTQVITVNKKHKYSIKNTTLGINDIQQNDTGPYVECHYSESGYDERDYTGCCIFIDILSVVMLLCRGTLLEFHNMAASCVV